MKGVIMAGGIGTRLRPLTCNIPKPMVPLLEKPVMEYSIELLKKHGITEIAVTTGYLSNHIKSYFGNGRKWGVSLTYFEESSPLGTAGSIKHAEAFLDEPFVVISGDAITNFNLTLATEFHQKQEALVTILMKHVENPLDYGLIMTHDDGRIRRFIEKPKWDEVISDYVNTGIYIIHPDIFALIPQNQLYDFSRDLFPKLLELNEKIYGYCSTGYWSDIGSLDQYLQTNFDLLNKVSQIDSAVQEILPGIWIGKNVMIEEGVKLNGPLLIGDNTIIKKDAVIENHSVIGANCIISENTVINRTVLWDDVFIGPGCNLFGTIIASKTQLKSSVTLQEHTVIGSHCEIKSKSIVKPTIKVWPNKIIQENTILNATVIWNKEVNSILFGRRGIHGIPNVDITSDFAIKLAQSYAATISRLEDVLVGCDDHPFSRLIQDVLTFGLHSAGISTMNCTNVIAPNFRYWTSVNEVQGGVFVSYDNNRKVTIEFYNEKGKPIDLSQERKIESIFRYEDFHRVSYDSIGSKKSILNPTSPYLNELLRLVKISVIKDVGFRIVVMAPESLQGMIKDILGTCHCELLFIPESMSIQEMSKSVIATKADCGIIFHQSGERFELIDDKGQYYNEEKLLSVFVLISFLTKKKKRMSIPLQGSSELEFLASKLQGIVIRTKDHIREQLKETEHIFHLRYDACYALTQMLEVLAVQNSSISNIMRIVPDIHLQREHVACPWDSKGRVMRLLLEEAKERAVDLLEGIKVYHPNGGWTLILPDIEQPMFTVYSQGPNPKLAREASKYFVKKIRQFQRV